MIQLMIYVSLHALLTLAEDVCPVLSPPPSSSQPRGEKNGGFEDLIVYPPHGCCSGTNRSLSLFSPSVLAERLLRRFSGAATFSLSFEEKEGGGEEPEQSEIKSLDSGSAIAVSVAMRQTMSLCKNESSFQTISG